MVLSSLISLIDDIAVLAKLTAHKAAGVVGDDIAVSAERMIGLAPSREIPVVLQVMKGALFNKILLVPLALLFNHYLPKALLPILFLGACYLAFEGADKCWHWLANRLALNNEKPTTKKKSTNNTAQVSEKALIRGAVRTDLVLSIEIILISLSMVASDPILEQAIVLFIVAFGLTFFIYGLVAWIIKFDDLGLYLTRSSYRICQSIGKGIVTAAPNILSGISIIGTVAMLYVAGSIIIHTVSALFQSHIPMLAHSGFLNNLATISITILLGGTVGLILLAAYTGVSKFIRAF
ncbi:MAG: DUF808 family protein [Cellvibrionales bacterium]|nr:DUF808 family protein [Cellvibrionales bacterium]